MEPYEPILHPACFSCLLKRRIDAVPATASDSEALAYMRRICEAAARLPDHASGPVIVDRFAAIRREMFGEDCDYSEIKRRFNELMLGRSDRMEERVRRSQDPLRTALGFAMAGNFIDFGAMDRVSEEKLDELLNRADTLIPEGSRSYLALRRDLASARRVVLLTDNCGEIVCDKLLVSTILSLFSGEGRGPSVTVIVRGAPVLNDATMEDARQVGFDRLPSVRVIGSGARIAGTPLPLVSEEVRTVLTSADVILSKGQGNFETLRGCGLNLYYLFLCKCSFFADRFGVPLYSGVLVRDDELDPDIRGGAAP